MKKSLLLVVSLVFVLVLSFTCFAEYYGNPIDSGACGKDGDNVIWTMYDSGTLVISGQGEMKDFRWWTISPEYDEYLWGFGRYAVRKIIIEPGITSIGDDAFLADINGKYDITVAPTVVEVGTGFGYYLNGRFENGIMYCGNIAAGYDESQNSFIFKDGTVAIQPDLFEFMTHEEHTEFYAYIPKTVHAFEGNPFRGVQNATVVLDPENPYMCVDEYGVIYNSDMTKLLAAPSSLYLGAYTIPDTVVEICDGAFFGCQNLYSIDFGKGVQIIGECAFSNCDSLSVVIVPGNVKTVELGAFNYCNELTKVYLLYGVEEIQDIPFYRCEKLSEIYLPNSLTTIGQGCFGYLPSLTEIDIPDSVCEFICVQRGTSGQEPVFSGNSNLKNIYIPKLKCSYFLTNGGISGDFANTTNVYVKNLTTEEINIMNDTIRKNEGINGWQWFPSTTQFLPIYVGSKINSYLNTDIVARIDGKPIRSYNIDGYTVIIAEDLKNYGFNVNFDNEKRILYVDDVKGEITSTYTDSAFRGRVGDVAGDVLYTDIDTYINGLPVKSYNIGGYTAIYISDLECFGAVVWNETERTISFIRN